MQNQSHTLSSIAVTVQTFSSQPTTLQTTLLLPPNIVLTVKLNPSNNNQQQPNNNNNEFLHEIYSSSGIGKVDGKINLALELRNRKEG